MKKQDLANAFDLLEPSQETKYNVKKTIHAKTEGRKPFIKRFKRPALAMTCFALASLLVISAAAAGGIQLFSFIYGSEVADYGKYISAASEPVSTQNVSFTMEGVLYDGYKGIAIVSLKALSETGKELIDQFNIDITTQMAWSYPPPSDLTGMQFYSPYNADNPAEHSLLICSKHMIITKAADQRSLSSLFTISSLTGALGEDKNYYKIIWDNGEWELPECKIGWTDNEETVLTDFNVSLITNTVEINCPEDEAATPEVSNPYKIVVSPIAIYVFSHTTSNLKIEDQRVDDQFLVKFTDGSIYDLYDGGRYGDPGVYGDYHAFQDNDKRKGYSTSSRYGDGTTYTSICSYTFGELIDLNEVESVNFFGVEYKLR